MNPLPPNVDELVSAYLDGQAAPDEIATVESSPELMARVQAMRAVAAQIGEPVAPPQAQKEAHIAAALGAFDEMFAAADGATDATTEPVAAAAAAPAPALQSVPAPIEPSPPQEAEVDTTVTSFDAARQRRRPRRMNMGVIAAAIAAVLLIGAFAVFGGGRGGDDVATSSLDAAAADTSTDAAADAGDDSGDAMEAEAESAMEDAVEERSALSEAQSAAPAPTAPPAAAAQPQPLESSDDGGVDDEAMADEEAADEAAADDAVEAGAEAEGDLDRDDADESETAEFGVPNVELSPFFLGEFDTDEQLKSVLTELSADDVRQRKATIGEGVFLRCQAQVPELATLSVPTLIADALVNGEPREVHVRGFELDSRTFFVIDPQDCNVVDSFP